MPKSDLLRFARVSCRLSSDTWTATSRDRLLDEMTTQPYFLTQVVVENVPREVRERLMARMPADVLRPTGERTVLDYLRPLKDRINSVLREK